MTRSTLLTDFIPIPNQVFTIDRLTLVAVSFCLVRCYFEDFFFVFRFSNCFNGSDWQTVEAHIEVSDVAFNLLWRSVVMSNLRARRASGRATTSTSSNMGKISFCEITITHLPLAPRGNFWTLVKFHDFNARIKNRAKNCSLCCVQVVFWILFEWSINQANPYSEYCSYWRFQEGSFSLLLPESFKATGSSERLWVKWKTKKSANVGEEGTEGVFASEEAELQRLLDMDQKDLTQLLRALSAARVSYSP